MNKNTLCQHTFVVNVNDVNKRNYKLLATNTVLADAEIVAIRTRRAGANRKSLGGLAIVNDANFEAAFLSLKVGTNEVYEKIPVEHIERATIQSPETGFPVNISNIDWNTSFVEVAETVAIDTNKVFEFTVTYRQR